MLDRKDKLRFLSEGKDSEFWKLISAEIDREIDQARLMQDKCLCQGDDARARYLAGVISSLQMIRYMPEKLYKRNLSVIEQASEYAGEMRDFMERILRRGRGIPSEGG